MSSILTYVKEKKERKIKTISKYQIQRSFLIIPSQRSCGGDIVYCPFVRPSVHPKSLSFLARTALRMLELMQKGLRNICLAKLGHFDSNFTFQGLWLSFLVEHNRFW